MLPLFNGNFFLVFIMVLVIFNIYTGNAKNQFGNKFGNTSKNKSMNDCSNHFMLFLNSSYYLMIRNLYNNSI